jgi:hypothetical protein
MTHKINIAIPKPCNQDWQAMTVADKSRFCDSCQKNVFDFTKSSDREIVIAFNKNNNLCGRFNASQLNRDLIIPKEKKPFWSAIAATVIAFLGLGNQETHAQSEAKKTEQTDKKVLTDEANSNLSNPQDEFYGVVVDEKGAPIPDVNIRLKGSKKFISSNFDGSFKIKACIGDTLIFTHFRSEYKEITLLNSSKNKIFVKMQKAKVVITAGMIIYNTKDED